MGDEPSRKQENKNKARKRVSRMEPKEKKIGLNQGMDIGLGQRLIFGPHVGRKPKEGLRSTGRTHLEPERLELSKIGPD